MSNFYKGDWFIMKEQEYYKEKIIEIVNEINNINLLIKVYTFVNTHLKLLKGEI